MQRTNVSHEDAWPVLGRIAGLLRVAGTQAWERAYLDLDDPAALTLAAEMDRLNALALLLLPQPAETHLRIPSPRIGTDPWSLLACAERESRCLSRLDPALAVLAAGLVDAVLEHHRG